jgi:predicted transcriptional regulator YheO
MSRSLLTNETSELDLLDQRPFDQTDFDILKSYEAVVDGLAMLIGSHCEIVLHSLQDLKCSAIRIANGEHTGRQIGSPITDLALRMLHDMTGADSSVSKCYFTRAKSGVLMKSVTIAIRNREHRVIGLLCINMNLDVPFSQIMSTFIPPETPEVNSSVNFASSVEDLVAQTLEFTIEEVNADRNVSNNAKNRQIVLNLYEKGIFDIKDAINQVADRLNISKHTVYLYIRQFKSGDFQGWISNAFCPNGDRPGLWHQQASSALFAGRGHELAASFLSEGVYNANQLTAPASDEFDLVRAWQAARKAGRRAAYLRGGGPASWRDDEPKPQLGLPGLICSPVLR